MERLTGKAGGASPRRFAWSLTTSASLHGAVFGLASLIGGWLASADATPRTALSRRVSLPVVAVARADFDEVAEAEPEPDRTEPDLEDAELIEEPRDENLPPPPERERVDPLADAPLVTGELLWSVAPPEREEEVSAEVAVPSEPAPTRIEIALEPEAGVVEAAVLEAPSPRYPRLSVRAGEEGTVTCRLHVSAEGRVTRVEVLESSGHARLDEAAVAALLRWRFRPRTVQGRPVAATLRHPVSFVLRARQPAPPPFPGATRILTPPTFPTP